jgi:hypothetical protein
MSGECDSIHSSAKDALTKVVEIILWNSEGQITGRPQCI